MLDVAHYLGARVKRLERKFEDEFAVDVDELERAITPETRLIVLTNLHNPSGALIPAETLRSIGEIAQRNGTRVLVDEAYLEMVFDADAPSAFRIGEEIASSEENPFIVTNSLTKVHGLSGLRCGWILAAPVLARRIWRFNDLFGVNAAHPAEQLSVVAFDHLERFRERARSLLETNRALLDAFLASQIGSSVLPAAGRHSCVSAPDDRRCGRIHSSCCATNTRRQLCPADSSRCRSTSASASAARPRNCATGWSESLPRSTSSRTVKHAPSTKTNVAVAPVLRVSDERLSCAQ